MIQWEYKAIYALHVMEDCTRLERLLNNYGKQGWELADMRFHYMILKRQIKDKVKVKL